MFNNFLRNLDNQDGFSSSTSIFASVAACLNRFIVMASLSALLSFNFEFPCFFETFSDMPLLLTPKNEDGVESPNPPRSDFNSSLICLREKNVQIKILRVN